MRIEEIKLEQLRTQFAIEFVRKIPSEEMLNILIPKVPDNVVDDAIQHAKEIVEQETAGDPGGVKPSLVNRDEEVREMVQKLLADGSTIRNVRSECERVFGPDRVPSKTSISRLRHSKPVDSMTA